MVLGFLSIAVIILAPVLGWIWLRRRNLGHLDISTSSVAYDHNSFGHILTWDKYCFYIHGKPVVLLSGEFHYWRLPDRSRWESILAQYKAAGLNCIRIYFHWGYHSPREGVYNFEGNRDIEYLLDLCEKLRLFVLAAPGPYICAETQAGGLPLWLTAKRHVRIRHMPYSFFRTYDDEYSKYCEEWFQAILPIFARHQITTKKNGCVIALQVENENIELIKGYPFGLHDDMRFLAKVSRDLGMNVPLFTNDPWDAGSFVSYPDTKLILGKPTFGIDLYGFDKYVIFCPTSAPLATINGKTVAKSSWGEWKPSDFVGALDKVETTVRSFGGGAATSPIFVPELQGGWFNHYTVPYTYDDVFDYYGEKYTRLIMDTIFAQGSTAVNFYMFYGGTNWGTIGDPDVYTSYDYSACIREFGHFCTRGRHLRLSLSFIRSFADVFSRTECADSALQSYRVTSSVPNFVAKIRRAVAPSTVDFVLYRNFDSSKSSSATVSIARPGLESVELKCKLPYKQSFIGLANYQVTNGLRLLLSTLPIYVRTWVKGQEVWIIQCDEFVNGQFAFYDDVIVEGSLSPIVSSQNGVSLVSFKESSGWAKIRSSSSLIDENNLIIIGLTGSDLMTLEPVYEESFWQNVTTGTGNVVKNGPVAIFWGAYGIRYDFHENSLFVEREIDGKDLYAIFASGVDSTFTQRMTQHHSFSGLEFVQCAPALPDTKERLLLATQIKSIPLKDIRTQNVDFSSFPWKNLPLKQGSSSIPSMDTIDYCFTSGHSAYKLEFSLSSVPSTALKFELTARHRVTIYLNGKILGGHMTYSLGVYRAGAKNGPDIGTYGGWKKYDLPPTLLRSGSNEIIVLTESMGLNRQPFFFNDCRSERGILEAKIQGSGDLKIQPTWYIAGVDVRELSVTFNISGLPGEFNPSKWQSSSLSTMNQDGSATFNATDLSKPVWFESAFDLPQNLQNEELRFPLRLHITGACMGYIYLNGTFIARYYGNGDGPQKDFYVPEKLILPTGNKVVVLAYHQSQSPSKSDVLTLQFKPWNVEDRGALVLSSGNVKEGGRVFALYRESVPLSRE